MKTQSNNKIEYSISERFAQAIVKAVLLPSSTDDQFVRLSENENIYSFKLASGTHGVCYDFDEGNDELNILARTISHSPLATLMRNENIYIVVCRSLKPDPVSCNPQNQ